MKKTFLLTYEQISWWDCKILIDFNHPNIQEKIKAMVQFWIGWESRLDDEDGDYTKAFLRQIAREIYIISFDGWNKEGVIQQFEEREGWYSMDGSNGIEILSVTSVGVEYDFDIEEKEVQS